MGKGSLEHGLDGNDMSKALDFKCIKMTVVELVKDILQYISKKSLGPHDCLGSPQTTEKPGLYRNGATCITV